MHEYKLSEIQQETKVNRQMISVNNVSYSSKNKPMFTDLSASFSDGEIIGITGAAGTGKSIFIELLKNRKSGYQGNILIDQKNIKTFSGREFKKSISHYSSIQNIINPESTVKDWIVGGRIHHKKRLSPYTGIDIDTAQKEMSNFGLDLLSEVRLKLISGTERSMASLARVFCAQSEILLLEKPESGLDLRQRLLLTKSMKKYTSSGSNIIILTSSDLNFISASCDRIIVLSENGIAESGTHKIITAEMIKKYFKVEAVVTNNIYSGLPEIQIIE